ncbi:hypothetical protein RB200_05555 [Streptomyces sp. PmtG]
MAAAQARVPFYGGLTPARRADDWLVDRDTYLTGIRDCVTTGASTMAAANGAGDQPDTGHRQARVSSAAPKDTSKRSHQMETLR